MIRFLRKYAGLLLLFTLFFACSKTKDGGSAPLYTDNLLELVGQRDSLSLLRDALERTDLTGYLRDSSNMTILAPLNSAFRAAGLDATEISSMNRDTLKAILLYHLIAAVSPSKSMPAGPNFPVLTVQGGYIYITHPGDSIFINGGRLPDRDIRASNGVMHTINVLLMPATASIGKLILNNPDFSYLEAAMERTASTDSNLVLLLDTLPAISFYAPDNQAFMDAGFPALADLQQATPDSLKKLLLNHIVQGIRFASDIGDSSYVRTLEGNLLLLRRGADFTIFNTADSTTGIIQQKDILATNGVWNSTNHLLKLE